MYILFACIGIACNQNTVQAPYTYAVAKIPWNESLGNHRAVLTVNAPAEAVKLSFEWRRPDKEVENHRFLILDAETGDTIPNIQRLKIENERCELLFGPVKKKELISSIICLTVYRRDMGFITGDIIRKKMNLISNGCL
nr:glycoside hydrolase domain-containing protein [Parabacteroides goldsteinii]